MKSIFTSKTFWFNILAGFVQSVPDIASHVPQPLGVIITSAVNVFLRAITTQGVTLG